MKKKDMALAIGWLDEISRLRNVDMSKNSSIFRRYMKYYIRRLNRGYSMQFENARRSTQYAKYHNGSSMQFENARRSTQYAKYHNGSSKANTSMINVDLMIVEFDNANSNVISELKTYISSNNCKAINFRKPIICSKVLSTNETVILTSLMFHDPETLIIDLHRILNPIFKEHTYRGPK